MAAKGYTALEIADALLAAIDEGSLASGARLRQEELAAQYQVSRIPIREALQKLESEGLLAIHPNRGAFRGVSQY